MQGHRIDRIEEQIRIEISEIIGREVQDPRIGLVTVTAVKASPDMRHARILVSVLGPAEERKRSLQGLRSAGGHIRRELGQRLSHLRRLPELTFEYDEEMEKSLRVEELLNKIKPEP